MNKKGVSAVSGNTSPIVGEKYTYHIADWYPDTLALERDPSQVTWELFIKRSDGKFGTTHIKKKGIGDFTFGEKALGHTFRLEAYLYKPEGGGLIITPRRDKIPRISKVELFYVDDSRGDTFSFMEKLRARAYTVNLFDEEVVFTLWEDDAKGGGHNKSNAPIATQKTKVDHNGIAATEFLLSKALMQKAMQGETDPQQLEFYITVEYYSHRKHASDNVEINNPFLKDSKPQSKKPPISSVSKAKGSPAEQKPKSKKEERGILENIDDQFRELWDWSENKGTIKKDQRPTIRKPEGRSPVVVSEAKQPTVTNCGEKHCIKRGDKSELIREINIRLAGFGGNIPTDEFTDRTEKMIKQFQRDYMKVPETGKVCGNVLRAIDEFQNKYIVDFDDSKCKCKKCNGFGNGKFSEDRQNSKIAELKRNYEYPGVHRSLIWALRAAMFYTTVIEKNLKYSIKCIFSGYRCWEDNAIHNRRSTNHMGKALDIHFNKNGKRTQVPKDIEEVRQKIFVKYLGNQVRWSEKNKFSLEPGIASYRGEYTASTWIHYDVRQFELQYLTDNFFVTNINQVNGESIVRIANRTNSNTCGCMGGGEVKQINSPAVVYKKQNHGFTVEDAEVALRIINDRYGKEMAQMIEKIYRWETGHFTSGQYINCGSPGMEAFGEAPSYGWNSDIYTKYPEYIPVGLWERYENKGKSGQGGNNQVTDRVKKYIVFPSVEAGMSYIAEFILRYKGNVGRWHSKDTTVQQNYIKDINTTIPRISNNF